MTYSLLSLRKFRYKLHPLRVFKLLFLVIFLSLFLAILIVPKFLDEKEKVKVFQATHTFIHSAYYYPTSKSLGRNAVALVTTMNKRTVSNITEYTINLIGTNRTDRWLKKATLTTEHLLDDRCDYSLITAQTNLVDNMAMLEIEAEGVLMKVPMKTPKYSAPKPVVFCVSPQFAAEQWQTFLVQLHVSKRYGAHLQLYIVSMVESYFKLIKEYEKMGLVSIEPWLTIKFPVTDGPYLEPNRNVELRNQAAAHTDCLLMYKEAASFVGILDMDDILIPNNANSYYEEFEREYAGSWLISALHYEKFDYKTIKVAELEEQSISAIVRNARRLPTKDSGKSFLRPERFNSSWSHYSRNADNQPIYLTPKQNEPFFMKLKTMKYNGIFHLKNMYMINSSRVPEGAIPVNPGDNITQLISEEHLQEIDEDLKRALATEGIAKLSLTLPKDDYYMPIVFKCYNESFYHIRDTQWLYNDVYCVNAYSSEMAKLHNWKKMASRLRLPWTKILAGIAVLGVLSLYWFGGDSPDPFYEEMNHLELKDTHAFIHSAYYFPNSKSLGKSAVAIVATMSKKSVVDLNKYQVRIVGTNSTDRFVTEAKLSTEHNPDDGCEYSTVLIQTNSLKYMSKLEIETRDGLFTLPILKPKKEAPKPVVFCVAPLFAAEQWQSLLMQLHVANKFGAHLHVYMTTLVEYYYQLLLELNELELLTAQPWLTIKFSQVLKPYVEPNRNLELRNPAAAYTDCLLQYKEAAQFVGFLEVEDLLFPLNANTYYEEFEREYEGSYDISALYYQVLEQQSVKSSSPYQQSLGRMLESASTVETAKKGRAVVRPERYNSTWTHYSTQAEKQPIYLTEKQEDPHFMNRKEIKSNVVMRFRKLKTVEVEMQLENGTDSSFSSIPMNPVSTDQKLLTDEHLRAIEADIRRTMKLPSLQKVIKHLPTTEYYSRYLEDCISGQSTGKKHCVSTKGCNLPNNASIPCRHSDGLYHSGRKMRPFTYHFATEPYFTRNLGCYQ
ncbi:unnamed protein product [Caenorhabditis sp. 36 PRJEB53466]|nr:unnamed protein product [Caenorhabditis sp. 36 PRJEB53466]